MRPDRASLLALLLTVGAVRAAEDPMAAVERAVRAAAERVAPSVVAIEAFGVGAPPQEAEPERPRGRRKGPQGERAGGFTRPGAGAGTGLVVGADGWILTSTWHFGENPPVFTVSLSDGERRVARIVAADHLRKLCLLRIDGVAGLTVPRFAPRGDLRVGQWAVALGRGFGGERPALSLGTISALSRISGMAVQTDAKIGPANYGGPLIDLEGRVIGACVPLAPGSAALAAGAEWYDSGIGFAVPLDPAATPLADLRAGRSLQPGWLGIAPGEGTWGEGVPVRQLAERSPAAAAGMRSKDVIVALDGAAVGDAAELRVRLGARAAGETLRLRVKRGDQELDIDVALGVAPNVPALQLERPEAPAAAPGPDEPPRAPR